MALAGKLEEFPEGGLLALNEMLAEWNGIPKHILADLREYLLFHEDDIANDINDFSHLKSAFEYLIGREVKNG